MNSRKTEFLAGLFFIVGVIAVAYLSIAIGGGQFFSKQTYLLKARFQDVGGLSIGSRVSIAGVPVGTVADITLDPETYSAVVHMRLKQSTRVDFDTIASVKSQGLIGDKYIALLPGGSEIFLEEGEMIVDTESAVDIEGLISQFAFGSLEKEDDTLLELEPLSPEPDTQPETLEPTGLEGSLAPPVNDTNTSQETPDASLLPDPEDGA